MACVVPVILVRCARALSPRAAGDWPYGSRRRGILPPRWLVAPVDVESCVLTDRVAHPARQSGEGVKESNVSDESDQSHVDLHPSIEPKLAVLLERHKESVSRSDWSYHEFLPVDALRAHTPVLSPS